MCRGGTEQCAAAPGRTGVRVAEKARVDAEARAQRLRIVQALGQRASARASPAELAGHVLNQDIGSWEVSAVREMSGMFDGATSFDKDISSWDVSAVTDMYCMFCDASSFDQDIGSWDDKRNFECGSGLICVAPSSACAKGCGNRPPPRARPPPLAPAQTIL